MDARLYQKIIACETEYIRCFSTFTEEDQVIRYRNDKLPDMYDHNYTFIKDFPAGEDPSLSGETIERILRAEIGRNRMESKDFCKLSMNRRPQENWLEGISPKPEIQHYGLYAYLQMQSTEWKVADGYSIRKVDSPSMVEDLVSMDMVHDGGSCGEDFCSRRAHLRGAVYLSGSPLNCWICYWNGIPVGNVDLFCHDGIVKIEDFAVLPDYQRRGIGTAIMKDRIDHALSGNAEMIYLVADEEDTPKEMYRRMGFEKVGETFALFFKPIA